MRVPHGRSAGHAGACGWLSQLAIRPPAPAFASAARPASHCTITNTDKSWHAMLEVLQGQLN
jgi:hypothetical protein